MGLSLKWCLTDIRNFPLYFVTIKSFTWYTAWLLPHWKDSRSWSIWQGFAWPSQTCSFVSRYQINQKRSVRWHQSSDFNRNADNLTMQKLACNLTIWLFWNLETYVFCHGALPRWRPIFLYQKETPTEWKLGQILFCADPKRSRCHSQAEYPSSRHQARKHHDRRNRSS